MDTLMAFFDDSGGPDPGSENVFALGLVVLPASQVKDCTAAWNDILSRHLNLDPRQLTLSNVEAKSADLYDMRLRLRSGKPLNNLLQRRMFRHGLKTEGDVTILIHDIWDFLASPPVSVNYLASVMLKSQVWSRYKSNALSAYQLAQVSGSKIVRTAARKELSRFAVEKTFDWLCQRLQYLCDDPEFECDSFLIGDEGSVSAAMYRTQADAHAGLRQFTDLGHLLNNVWFGSSLHNPLIQMADWVAYATRLWLSSKNEGNRRLAQIAPNFRGYPDEIAGRGIVVNPRGFRPSIPLVARGLSQSVRTP